MNIYDRIKAVADRKGITISRIEKECGLSNASIKKWAISKPAADKLQKVSDFLQVDVNYLLGRKDTPTLEKPISNPRPDLVIPEILQQVGIGFHEGAENLTQEDIDDMAFALELRRKRK